MAFASPAATADGRVLAAGGAAGLAFIAGPSALPSEESRADPPPRSPAAASAAVAAIFSFTTSMARIPLSLSATATEDDPATTAPPAARFIAASTVDPIHPSGTAASARHAASSADDPTAEANPRRASRSRSRARPRESRLATVPDDQPSWVAASWRVRPSRSHRRIGARYFAGSRATSSWIARRSSSASSRRPIGSRIGRRPSLDLAPPRGVGVRLDADPPRDLVEPARQRVADPDRAGLADEHEEGRLEGVLRVVRVAEDAPAGDQDGRPVPLDDRRERRLVAAGDEAVEELRVGQPGDAPRASNSVWICRKAAPSRAVAMAPLPPVVRSPLIKGPGGTS